MNQRIKRLREALRVERFPICVEKAEIVLESFKNNDGWPQIIRRARATADYLDKKTIFIDPDELIVGNIASKPMGMEMGSGGPGWPDDDLDDLLSGGQIYLSEEDRKVIRSMDEYYSGKGRTQDERQGFYYNDERLWPFIKRGFLCPPWQRKDLGRGQGAAGMGWGLGMGPTTLNCPDYGIIIHRGIGAFIEEAEHKLLELRFYDEDSIKKANFYKACLSALPAIIRIANRYADLAETMAMDESDAVRRNELQRIAETCRRVPEYPARTFREGMQSFFFYWLMVAHGAQPGGRMDQYLWPLYKADLEAGRITRDEALELFECLRLKIMQLNFVGGGKNQREKWAGMARWHNFIIGGCDSDGKDATNELSYLMLEAALDCQTPHHTLTIRVGKDTPIDFLVKGMEVVKTGIGMPAFISEEGYIDFVTKQGVPIKEARDFAIAGCMDLMLPGKSRNQAFGMSIIPMYLEATLYNGREPKSGELLGLETGEFESFKTYEDFYRAFLQQCRHFVGMVVEEHNILLMAQRELYPDVVTSAFLHDAMNVARDGLDRRLPFENGSAVNVVGMANTVDSLAALKKVVFDDKLVSASTMMKALRANWEGYDDVRKLCVDAPKYGNNNSYVDEIAGRFWRDFAAIVESFKSIFGAKVLPTAISITAHAPGGAMTSATPDGRMDGETFADGSISPVQGVDTCGPLAVLQSAMNLPQSDYMATLLNMKFHPTAMKTEEDLNKIAAMVKTYLTNGGKQIQLNVVSKDMLEEAKRDKEKYRDLIVRVAGYSAYYVTLTERVQDEIIARTEQKM